MKLAKEQGTAITINVKEKDAVQEIIEITRGGVHVVVDALGVATTCQNAINSLRKNPEDNIEKLSIYRIVKIDIRLIRLGHISIFYYSEFYCYI